MGYSGWTEQEDEILRKTYPNEGVSGTVRALSRSGYKRTAGAVKMHAKLLGVKANRIRATKRKVRDGKRRYGPSTERTIINICLNNGMDADVIRALKSKNNRSEYVRNLVRRDIRK